jgi:hypothetical protein
MPEARAQLTMGRRTEQHRAREASIAHEHTLTGSAFATAATRMSSRSLTQSYLAAFFQLLGGGGCNAVGGRQLAKAAVPTPPFASWITHGTTRPDGCLAAGD